MILKISQNYLKKQKTFGAVWVQSFGVLLFQLFVVELVQSFSVVLVQGLSIKCITEVICLPKISENIKKKKKKGLAEKIMVSKCTNILIN